MSQFQFYQLLLWGLEGTISENVDPHETAGVMRNMTKEQAYEYLKGGTGQDFGYDVEAWEKWFEEQILNQGDLRHWTADDN